MLLQAFADKEIAIIFAQRQQLATILLRVSYRKELVPRLLLLPVPYHKEITPQQLATTITLTVKN